MGAIVFVALRQSDLELNIAALIGALVVIATRILSIYFDLHLPKFKSGKKA
jgi:uncharacterized membrane protein YeiH